MQKLFPSKRVNLWTHKRTGSSVSDFSLPSSSSHPSAMLSVNDALHGWSPIGADDEDVTVSPPASLTVISHSMAPSSDRRAQRNRNRDPSWIPRPRNAFIIFRCEYSREHSQGSQEPQSDDDSTNPTVKTLSKRAAEAWKQLPSPERERYKVLADKEREEHARLYPHYRFRPMKRQASEQGKTSRERSQGPRTHSVERLPVPSAHFPSVLARAPEKPRSSPSFEHADASTAVSQAGRLSLPDLTFPIDPQEGPQMSEPLILGCNDPLLSCSLPDTPFPSALSPLSAPAELYAPLCRSAVNIPPDAFRCEDTVSGVDPPQDDIERAQALEAYAIGLYNYDLYSPFSFPEYY